MKHTKLFLSAFFLGLTIAGSHQSSVFAATNLIGNPSMEVGLAGQPTGWAKSYTGMNNAVFNYPVAGYSGNGANIAITQFSSGRAEWYFTEVPAVSGSKYTYTEMYKAGVSSAVRARFNTLSGGYQYVLLGSPASASGWTKVTYNFTAPSLAKSVAVMHGLTGAGSLSIDEASLVLMDTQKPTVSVTSPVANQSVNGTIKLRAAAVDNEGVAGVQFVIDGVNVGTEDKLAPFEIDWSSTASFVGTHFVKAIARDLAGNTTTSAAVYFSVAAKPDTTAPVVLNTWPVAGAKLSGTVILTASAIDLIVSGAVTSGVKQVQFLIDGTVVGTTATAPYQLSYNSSALSNGTHSIIARATDNASNVGNSPAVVFSVTATIKPDTTAPAVQITSPVAGSKLSGMVNLSASATDPVISGAVTSGVKQVQFLIDGTVVGTTATAPYQLSYDTKTLSNGSRVISGRATDNVGNVGNSPAISVTISNQVNTDNLVPNPSLEIADPADPSKPANWSFSSWSTTGISALSTYPVAGFDGLKAAKVEITAYKTDGDAKWYFDPQSVTAGTKYNVSDNFKSNIPSRVVASFTLSNGTSSNLELSPAASAANWTAYSDFVTAPAGAVKMSVFHLIDRVGWLQTDNYSVTVAPVSANLFFNGDLEIPSLSDPALPAHWYQGAWGTNVRAFSYASGLGRSGSRGAKVTITSYTDGDARWYTDDLPVVPGEYYKFFDWYKSSTDTRVVAHFVYTDNTDHYVDLRGASAAGDWTAYSDYVQIPANAKTMSVYQLITGVGWLATDDYSLQKTTISGFNHPLVTLSFDDGWEDNVGNVLPVLNSSGFKANFYFCTQFIEGNGSDIPASPAGVAAVKTIFNAGNEVGSHSVTHPFLTTATGTNLNYELSHSKAYLESIVGPGNIKSFATPYGAYNQTVLTAIKSYYQSHRTVDTGYNLPDGFDPYRIKVQNMLVGTTLAEYQGWLNEAKKNNLWLVLVYHRIADPATSTLGALGDYDTPLANFGPQMNALKNSGIMVKPVTGALADLGS